LIRRRFVAISVEILPGVDEVAAVSSRDRVAHLSISESSPASGPLNWTSGNTISPRMSRYPRETATDLAKGGGSPRPGMAGTFEGSSVASLG
jgi:hypothetical protein